MSERNNWKCVSLIALIGLGTASLPAFVVDEKPIKKPDPPIRSPQEATAEVQDAAAAAKKQAAIAAEAAQQAGEAKKDGDAKADAAKPNAEGMVELFNGKDLTGWDGNKDFWSVKDGVIQGQTTKENPTKGNTFLVWTGGDVADFEMHFKFKITGGNSGVQYRSKLKDPKTWSVGGYQADFESGKTYSGILYEEQGRGILAQRGTKVTIGPDGKKKEEKLAMSSEELQKAIKADDWNDYVIVAKGNHLTHKINGNVTAEVIDEEEGEKQGAKSGILALQLHQGPPMVVQFKELHLKPMKDAK